MWSKAFIFATSFGIATASTHSAHSEPNPCATAYEQAQELRADGKLRQARKALESCVQPTCSEFVRTECGRWLSEVEASMPSLVLVAKNGGKELELVRVLYDDEPIKENLDGKAVPVDPGQHTLQFLTSNAQPTTLKIVIREGEKNRQVVVELPTQPSPEPKLEPKTGSYSAPEVKASHSWLPYALGGIGLLGVSGFVAFGLMGNSEYTDRQHTCGRACSDSEVGTVRMKYYLADASLGVGIVTLGVASYLYFSSNHEEKKLDASTDKTAFDLRWSHGGGVAEFRTRF